MGNDYILIQGAREHNLKSINLKIPRGKIVVITGPSGSGKSSLAIDTIFAEGQRRYVEALSAYARQYLELMPRPEVDFIDGLSPAIAIEQKTAASNPRSTIATTTEIYDYLRLLFATIGEPHCPTTGKPLIRQTSSEIIDQLCALPKGTRVIILAPVISNTQCNIRSVLSAFEKEGFIRARIDGVIYELSAHNNMKFDENKPHTVEIIIDRLIIDENSRVRIADSVETALKFGNGRIVASIQGAPTSTTNNVNTNSYETIKTSHTNSWEDLLFSTNYYSPETNEWFEKPEPRDFSFNAPYGTCPNCAGLGYQLSFDEELIVKDPKKSLSEGAIAPWYRKSPKLKRFYEIIIQDLARHYKQRLDTPFKNLSDDFKKILFWGSGDEKIEFHLLANKEPIIKPFEGLIPLLEKTFNETKSIEKKSFLKRYMSLSTCKACNGTRLTPRILAVTLKSKAAFQDSIGFKKINPHIPGLSIIDVCRLTISRAIDFFENLILSDFQSKIIKEIHKEIITRLRFIAGVGLGYLTLDRECGTLSGGEYQRIRIASQLGSSLTGVIYILDEPSIGLHQRDNELLISTIKQLKELGNSVIIVEHDSEIILNADYIIDLGPGAGVNGGRLVASGTPAEIINNPDSLTGQYLSGKLTITSPKHKTVSLNSDKILKIIGAKQNNLKNIDVTIPLGVITCVTGVSGSGKSTLIDEILRKELFRIFYGAKEKSGAHDAILGTEFINKVIVVDQSPIGRTPRSNPATYTGLFDIIREIFSQLSASKIRGFGPSRFSFNTKGGCCEKCQGDGVIKFEMHFLPPVYVTCDKCNGKRYNKETLEVVYRGKNIADVLEMSFDEAFNFFKSFPQITEICRTLQEVGLGYLKLGQAGTTLSGGEAQRLKLAKELSKRNTGQTLYILDEPTTGLHFHDINRLMDVLFKLRDLGNTIIIVEHNMDVIKCADWIIDLGPEGGDKGGYVVAQGPPETIACSPISYTGKYLSAILTKEKAANPIHVSSFSKQSLT
jgi:excinuclease ABC subunit A